MIAIARAIANRMIAIANVIAIIVAMVVVAIVVLVAATRIMKTASATAAITVIATVIAAIIAIVQDAVISVAIADRPAIRALVTRMNQLETGVVGVFNFSKLMKIDLQTLEESVRNEILALAEDSLNYDGRFAYQGKQYYAKTLQDTSIGIYMFEIAQYKINNFSADNKKKFSDKIKIAKESADPMDKKFQIEDVIIEVKQSEPGKFIISTSLAKNQ